MFAGIKAYDTGDENIWQPAPCTHQWSKRLSFRLPVFWPVGNRGFLSQQISIADDGGFKMRTDGVTPDLGSSSTWLVALNVQVPLPFFTSIFIFGDAGFVPETADYRAFNTMPGIGLTLIPNIATVYFPFILSQDMKNNLNTTTFYDQWYQRISFSIQLDKLNPMTLIRNLDL
jgi:hypothetical protein